MNLASGVEVVAGAPHVEDLVVEPLVEIFLINAETRSTGRIHAWVKSDLYLPELALDEAAPADLYHLGVQAPQARIWEEVNFLLRFIDFLEVLPRFTLNQVAIFATHNQAEGAVLLWQSDGRHGIESCLFLEEPEHQIHLVLFQVLVWKVAQIDHFCELARRGRVGRGDRLRPQIDIDYHDEKRADRADRTKVSPVPRITLKVDRDFTSMQVKHAK